MKNLILCADDFGYSKENNEAVKLGYDTGLITSAALMANMDGFEHAVNEIIPAALNLKLGFHFNIIEGKSLSCVPLLCDLNGNFNKNFIQIMAKSQNKEFLMQIEKEFRAQIERILSYCNISYINSHVHVHAIPTVFNLIAKLAEEYNLKYIRTQHEIPYIVWKKSFNIKFAANILKSILLNSFTEINKKKLDDLEINTNKYFIGILYTGFMDEEAIIKGLQKINNENSLTEVIFHPYYSKKIPVEKKNNYREFQITQNTKFIEEIKKLGFNLI